MRQCLPVLLCAALLCACGGGGGVTAYDLMSGTATTGVPLAGAAVRIRCVDGTVLNTTTNALGVWQAVVSGLKLPCALQASGGTLDGLANTTAYHSVAVTMGVNNLTPLTNLVTARLLGAAPQPWFNNPSFAVVTAPAVQTALASVSDALGLGTGLRQSNPLTQAFTAVVEDYLDGVLMVMQSTLVNPAVNKTYAELLAAAASGDFSGFASYSATFALEHTKLYGY
jgi:hypothetical protein